MTQYIGTDLYNIMPRPFACSFFKLTALLLVCFTLWVRPVALLAMEICNAPLETAIHTPPPRLVMVLDNSGSMDWEVMTPESEGLFHEGFYVFPDSAYDPSIDHHYGDGHSLTPPQRRMWKSQWAGYNRIYFDPKQHYSPWLSTPKYTFIPADLNRPWSDPIQTDSDDARIDLSAEYFSVRLGTDTIRILNAHYYTFGDRNANGVRDTDEAIYLVTWTDQDHDGNLDVGGNANTDRRCYYRFDDDGDGLVEDDELVPVTSEAEKDVIRPSVVNTDGVFVRHQTDKEALQNFANWCTYYRRRMFTLKAVAARLISGLSHMSVGLYAVNNGPRVGVKPINVSVNGGVEDNAPLMLNALYAMQSGGGTPLRSALERVGRYFRGESNVGFGESLDMGTAGGGCQRHLALVISDGGWNGQFTGFGNVDGDNGAPYADSYANTLADVAAHFYENDLRPGIEDQMPPFNCADVTHQHMITLTLSFGQNGTIDVFDMDGGGTLDQTVYRDDPCFDSSQTEIPEWGQPIGLAGHEVNGSTTTGTGTGELIDDLWHAAINGHGCYYSMDQDVAIRRHLLSGPPQSSDTSISGELILDSEQLTDKSILYRTSYTPAGWYGDLTAWASAGGAFDQLLWRASKQFQQPGFDWNHRRVVTYGGRSAPPKGIPFHYDGLSKRRQSALCKDFDLRTNTAQKGRDLIEYVRGASLPQFRTRTHLLGDIVHSTPVVVDNTIFIGANDGMLHAFDARNGQERFAYVPNLVLGHLKALSEPAYPKHHRFYVDGPLWAGDVVVGPYQRRTYLVGGLGKGGRGYFCLLVGSRRRSRDPSGYGAYQWDFHVDQLNSNVDENSASKVVQWEYPRPDPAVDGMDNNGNGIVDESGETDPHIGYTLGQGYAVNANSANNTHRPVVIFGNGYNSPDQSAVLYVLAADTGEIVRKIHTAAVGDNGLSTPALIDVNRDNRIDYAYAGDLKGNMWKFDLSADDPRYWAVAYGEDRNGDNLINVAAGDLPLPLFQATDQPITGRPDIMTVANACNPQADGFMVIFGTGKFLSPEDQGDTRQQSIYGIWDYGDDDDNGEHLGYLLDRTMGFLSSGLSLVRQEVVDQVTVDGVATRQISQNPVNYLTVDDPTSTDQSPDPQHHAGWFLDFPIASDPMAHAGERITGHVTIRGGKAVVNTLVPTQELCEGGGSSWTYIIKGCSGSQPEVIANTLQGAKRYNGRLISKPTIVKDPSHPQQDQLLIPGPAGGMITEAFVGELWGRAYWWQNID